MQAAWTLNGDDTSWSLWADSHAHGPASPLVQDLIAAYRASRQGWAIDVGCGTGRAFLPLVEAGYQVIGLDATPNALRLSQQQVSETHIPAYPILASAARFPLPGECASFVFAMSTLFHLSLAELTSALHEVRRVLLPGGAALLHFLDLDDWRRSLASEVACEQVPVPSYRAVVTCFCSQVTIQEWIAQAGLKLLLLELRTSASEAGQQRNWLAHCRKVTDGLLRASP